MQQEGSTSTLKQAGKFSLVGIFNTVFDFIVFNIVSRIGVPVIAANTFSTLLAMIVSFFINRTWVFGATSKKKVIQQALKFFIVTAIGLWVIQNGIIALLVKAEWFVGFATLVRQILFGLFDDQFFIHNGAKAVGTIASLIWNFFLYKKVVFRK